ncbi:hypothetical protein OnM2_012027 [Erysiphe neolycopersici]|uniref:Uncharacterized protein n=1 Tax=Erysiphe neolycopersici TaxID=212602 RepID=A0A420I634_9PEZI|nr:hypothetical protein OnM2_012027 [Erysiphe neolycopersici]
MKLFFSLILQASFYSLILCYTVLIPDFDVRCRDDDITAAQLAAKTGIGCSKLGNLKGMLESEIGFVKLYKGNNFKHSEQSMRVG